MHILELAFFGLIALLWLTYGAHVAIGAFRLPWLKDFAPASDDTCPKISLLFAARDEEEKLPAALATLMAIDYPLLEIIGVDDRSTDRTSTILKDFATRYPRLRAVRVDELPRGWLGKPHALQKAYEASSGEWLLLTDADVCFRPDAVRRAVALATSRKLDHLTLLGDVEMRGFWERALLTFFALGFNVAANPGAVTDPRSRSYIGVGAFQLVRRSAYEASGTHRRLAMEVVDDMKLGKIVKQSGFRSGAAVAQDFVAVEWHSGAGNIVKGVTKNFFAGAEYSVGLVVLMVAALLLLDIAPWIALPLVRGWSLLFAAVGVAVPLSFHAAVAKVMRASPFYALTHPLGAAAIAYMLLRSTVVTLRQGGVTWRGTFYPLDELRRGSV